MIGGELIYDLPRPLLILICHAAVPEQKRDLFAAQIADCHVVIRDQGAAPPRIVIILNIPLISAVLAYSYTLSGVDDLL